MRLKLRLDRGCFFSSCLFADTGIVQRALTKVLTGITLSHCSEPISLHHLEVSLRLLSEPYPGCASPAANPTPNYNRSWGRSCQALGLGQVADRF